MIEQSGRERFRVLGPLEVWAGTGWAPIGAAKWRALLACLLLNPGQLVSTGQLIAELWGDRPPAKAGNLVAVYVHRLRRLIGDADGSVLVTRSPGYRLVVQPGELDAGRFAQLAADGQAALAAGEHERAARLLAAGLGLWRGEALSDVPPTPLVAAEADRLEESRVRALELRIEADLGCGRADQVVPELRRLLAGHPLREGLWALLMRALQAAGRQAEALEVYGQAREVISAELGVDPGAGVQQIYQDILDVDAAGAAARPDAGSAGERHGPAPPAPAQLPADIPDFTGRAGQLEELRTLLAGGGEPASPGAVPVVVIVGSGGLGKTALAVHLAHLLAARFPDGQLYANLLGATEPADPAEVLARFLRDLGTDAGQIPVDLEERAARFRSRLAGRRVLVVLDDARDAAQVRPLLPGTASCAVLITSRRRLPELAGTRLMDLDVLPLPEARTLFGRVAGAGRAQAEPEATDEVLMACAGLPLAIRIAGARLASRGNWNVQALAGRLADERRRLDELRAGNLAVRASFEVSFASLPGAAGPGSVSPARAFRLLGLWIGPSIGLAAAAALLGQPDRAAEDVLNVLVDAHLMDSPGPDRYRFHDLLRVYAADRVQAQESEQDRRDVVIRVLSWYLHSAEAAAKLISPQHTRVPLEPLPDGVRPAAFATLDEALDWCEAERENLAAASRLAAAASLDEFGWKLPAAAMSFYYRRSHWVDWAATHRIGLACAQALADRRAQAWMLNNLGMAYGQQRLEESITCFEQALTLCRELGDLAGEARTANNVATACFDLHRYIEALDAARESLTIQRKAGKRYGEGLALGVLGGACSELGRFDQAIAHLGEALVIFRELSDHDSVADALGDLGDACLGMGRTEEAVRCYTESLAIWQTVGNRYGQAAALRRLGDAQRRAGDPGQAHALLAEAMGLFEELGDQSQAESIRASLVAALEEAG